MYYKALYVRAGEYQEESFNRALTKKDGTEWGSNESAAYKMTNTEGEEVSSGSLTKSGDSLSLILAIPDDDTVGIVGSHRILVRLSLGDDATFNDVIADYSIMYKDERAT